MININWIECNLPYHLHTKYEDEPEYPFDIINQKGKEFFGKTEKDFEIPQELDDLSNAIDKEYESLSNDFDYKGYHNDKRLKEYFQCLDQQIEFRKKWDQWKQNQPEVLAYENSLDQFEKNEALKSFCGRELNKPGTLIETIDGKIHLIGSINEVGGVCADCKFYTNEDDVIIKRYAVVFDMTEITL